MVAEEGIFFLADLDGAAAELRESLVSPTIDLYTLPSYHLYPNFDILLSSNTSRTPLNSSLLFLSQLFPSSSSPTTNDKEPTYLRNQHLITRLHAGRDPLSLLINRARAHGQHLRLVEVLDGGLGQENAACGLGLGLYALHQDAVEERGDGADGLEGGL